MATPNEIAAAAACFTCLDDVQQRAAKLYLLDQLSAGGVPGSGTVTSVSVVTANGVSGSVANPNTTPAITLTLGAITPTTVNGFTFIGTGGSTVDFGTGGTVQYGASSGTVTSVSVVTANGFSGTVATATTTPAITIIAGAITPISVSLTGTAGAGFVRYLTQSANPTPGASGFVEFADSTGRKSWIRQSDGFMRTWDATLTGNRVYTLQDASGIIAFTNLAQTISGDQTFSGRIISTVNGASLAPPVSIVGTVFTGGGATNTKPQLLVEPTGTTSSLWSNSGTMIGANAPVGFGGSLIDLKVNGATYFRVDSNASLYILNTIIFGTVSDTFMFRRSAAVIQFGTVDAAAPVAQTTRVQSVVAGTLDTAGAAWNISGSVGTGTGTGGSIIFNVAPAGSTATTQNALTPALTLSGEKVATFTGNLILTQTGLVSTPMLAITGATFTGGSATTTKPSLLVEPAGAGSTTWSVNGTLIGANANAGTPNLIDLQTSGATKFNVSSTGAVVTASTVTVPGTSSYRISGRGNLSASADGAWVFNNNAASGFTSLTLGADTATPASPSIRAASGVGSNIAGGALTLVGGLSTGSGLGGSIIFQTSPATASSSTANTATTAVTIDSAGLTTFAFPLRLKGFTVATLPAAGTAGRRAYVTDATAPVWNTALTGGGAIVCAVFDNGVAWVAG